MQFPRQAMNIPHQAVGHLFHFVDSVLNPHGIGTSILKPSQHRLHHLHIVADPSLNLGLETWVIRVRQITGQAQRQIRHEGTLFSKPLKAEF